MIRYVFILPIMIMLSGCGPLIGATLGVGGAYVANDNRYDEDKPLCQMETVTDSFENVDNDREVLMYLFRYKRGWDCSEEYAIMGSYYSVLNNLNLLSRVTDNKKNEFNITTNSISNAYAIKGTNFLFVIPEDVIRNSDNFEFTMYGRTGNYKKVKIPKSKLKSWLKDVDKFKADNKKQ